MTYAVTNYGPGRIIKTSWRDAVHISQSQTLDSNAVLLGTCTAPTNDLAVGSGYANTLSVTAPASLDGGIWYLILSTDDHWQVFEQHRENNTLAIPVDLAVPVLSADLAQAAVFGPGSQAHYYRIDVQAGQSLRVFLDELENQGQSELYARFGAFPTRGLYDVRSTGAVGADQRLFVPQATAGTWYILAYAASLSGSGTYQITADFSDLMLNAVVPDRYGQTNNVLLSLSGGGFDAGTFVGLVAGNGTVYPAQSAAADSFTQLRAAFDLSSAPLGHYAVRVWSPFGVTNELANAFEVLPPREAKLETAVIPPASLGWHTVGTIWVEYRNTGNAAMPAPLLVLTCTNNGRAGALLTLDAARVTGGFWTSAQPEGFSHSIQFLASSQTPGVLQPGESGRVPVYYAGWQQPWGGPDRLFHWNLGALTVDDATPANWADYKNSMKPDSIDAGAWDIIWANFVTELGPTWGDYLRFLDNTAAHPIPAGWLRLAPVDLRSLLAFAFLQADGLSPLRTLASAVDGAVEARGLALVFSRSFQEPISQRFVLGPLGRGWSHNWQYSLSKAADGTVTVLGPAGSRRVFQPDSRSSGAYFAQAGDHGILTPSAGDGFTLRETSGLVRVFRRDGKLDYVQDPNGNRITAAYVGNLLTSLTHSSGQRLQIGYNGAGRIQRITDHLGRQTVLDYDAANEHLIGAQYYDGRTATYEYETQPASPALHALTSAANSCCTRRYFTYDSQGHLSSTYRDGNAELLTFTYETGGKVTVTDAFTNSSMFYFDQRGLLAKTEDALGNAVSLDFDDNYNLVRLTDPAGRSYNYAYDGSGNLTQTTDPLGHASRFTYQAAFNRLASVIDANGNVTSYAYDDSGNLQSITYADGSRESWAYDAYGNATTWTNRRGSALNYGYSPSGQLVFKAFSDGSRPLYSYDAHGNLILTSDPTGNTTFDYDANDRLTQIHFPGGRWLTFTYDSAGRRASSLDQLGHLLDYSYDTVGRLESLTNELGVAVVRYTYDAAGRLARKTLGNGMFTTYEYDAAGQLLNLTNCLADGTVLSRFNYSYDSRGRRTAMDTLDGRWTYGYDDLGQLTRAVFASTTTNIPSQDLTYVYDALGNRLQTIENGVTAWYTNNSLNQYVQRAEVGGQTVSYIFDADGNLVTELSTTNSQVSTNAAYTYNDENRLIAVTTPQGTWQYTYDALGNRVATTENGVTKRYLIDPIGLGNVVGEYDETGNLIARYDHALGLLSRTDPAGNPAVYTFDAIGNVQQMVTPAGTVANAYAYDPFGTTLRQAEAVPNSFLFAGKYGAVKDGDGLGFMRARYYHAGLRSFVSGDSFRLNRSFSTYAYAFNNPVSYCDPTGDWGWQDAALWGGRGAIVGGISGWMSGGWQGSLKGALQGGIRGAILGFVLPPWAILSPVAPFIGAFAGVFDFATPMPLNDVPEEHGPLAPPPGLPPTYASPAGPMLSPPVPMPWFLPTLPIPFTQPGPGGSTATTTGYDPNRMFGPAGFGPSAFISPSGLFAYRIDFENETDAAAPAQQVAITDQLSTNLDWTTFQLTEIGFGDQLIVPPPYTAHFETNVPVSYLGTNFQVQIEVGLQAALGQVYVNFRSIDPGTRLPPPAGIGFLPPEDGTGRGQGHVSYTVTARTSLPTGTQLRNVALISFDNLPALPTDLVDPHNPSAGTDPAKECLNTIDAGAPKSAVTPLPAQTAQFQFLVSWSGQDDSGGSGVASFDIYVSDSNGPWTLWQNAVTSQSALFTGQFGHTYGFYSVARDYVGNTEAPHASPDATTTIIATAELQVDITYSSSYLMVGDQWSYTITVINSGSVAATGVFLTNTVPAGLTLVSVLWDSGVCSRAGNVLSWQIGDLAVGASSSLTVTATTGTEGSFTNAIVFGGSPPLATVLQNPVITVTPKRPVLAITYVGGTMMLQWPVSPEGYLLESCVALGPQSAWTLVTATPWTVGNMKVLVIQPTGDAQYFRLSKP